MNIPSRTELRTLMEQHPGPCISILLPTHRSGVEIQQDPLRLRHAVQEAEHGISRQGSCYRDLHSAQVEHMLAPIHALLENKQFWLHPTDGLAIFRSLDVFVTYWLPSSLREEVVVGEQFHLKPLLPFLTGDGHFSILALSQNDIRLLEGTHYTVKEVELPEAVPESLAEALKYDEPDNQIRYYSSSSRAAVRKGGRRPAIFYGQGVGIDETKDNLLRYFQQINRGLHELFKDETAPLVLAGVEYLFPIYREANTYPHLLEQGVPGNPDKLRAETLRERAWSVVEPYFLKVRQEAATHYSDYAGTGRASSDINEIVPAASSGRVELVFVAVDQEQWGTFDPSTSTVHIHQQAEVNDVDLLNLVAIQTLLHGGKVYAVERAQVPGEALLAVVFRY